MGEEKIFRQKSKKDSWKKAKIKGSESLGGYSLRDEKEVKMKKKKKKKEERKWI